VTALAALIGLAGCVGTAASSRPAPARCPADAAWSGRPDVPRCGALFGVALPATDSQLPAAVSAVQLQLHRDLDVVHTYHRFYDRFPTDNESALARQGHMVFFNWEPVDQRGRLMSWSAIAAGVHDDSIDRTARRLAALPGTALVSFSHEPELHLHEHGSVTDFAAAFRRVVDRVRAAGATRVRWVWNVMGLTDPIWRARYLQLWPGGRYVDWIAWDPYNFASCRDKPWRSFEATVRPFYDWLATADLGDKPLMLAEYGTVEQAGNGPSKADWLARIPFALSRLPRLRALVYFDLPSPPANCDWLVTTSPRATAAFGAVGLSQPFRWAAAHHAPAG
jgi:hypothetical protein